ncbi:hypothetical protein [Actinoplanes sp. NBRC 103695]|uniref:hypothetical protein n=1 Tax=Actinoplanes sp. NBRC 103695 TaxID=3032202 RepID=UPI0024A554C1|nr:hypothetical protein [Actinoplanes sp. NBRC 103695]GLY96136.1 hypothetical protein Acsp02_33910 [Actinoplanes sp. NBRC 103695]
MSRKLAAAAIALAGPLVAAPAASAAPPACFDRSAATTFEESRIDTPALPGGQQVPSALVEAGGFTSYVERLRTDLCKARSVAAADRVLAQHGRRLWHDAVERAQGRLWMGTIERYDDRPLYWTRLIGTRDLRQWRPSFGVSDEARAGLLRTFEYAARGVTTAKFPTRDAVTKVLVSGFDPYQLNNEIRRSNPSGASALQLDGVTFKAGGKTIRIETVALPVTWSGFNAGIVEDAFGPHLAANAGGQRADLIMTISQGNRGTMNIEQWAGAWRGGSPDNNNEGTPEPIPPAAGWPQPSPQPEFIETTLPYQAMIDARTTPWPTRLNQQLCEWAAGDRPTGPVTCKTTGPTPGGQAESGGGGSYLSNESMYRSNRLRLALGATDIPGGHLHISALVYPSNPLVIIDQAFAADRAQTIEQTIALVKAAGASVSG